MVAGLNCSGATNLEIKDFPRSTARGANAASNVIGSMIIVLQSNQTVESLPAELALEELMSLP